MDKTNVTTADIIGSPNGIAGGIRSSSSQVITRKSPRDLFGVDVTKKSMSDDMDVDSTLVKDDRVADISEDDDRSELLSEAYSNIFAEIADSDVVDENDDANENDISDAELDDEYDEYEDEKKDEEDREDDDTNELENNVSSSLSESDRKLLEESINAAMSSSSLDYGLVD